MDTNDPASAKLADLFNVVLHAPATAVREYVTGQQGIDIERANDKGDTALLLAARRGDIDVVQALLDPPICANIHTRNLKGSNALIAAAMKGHTGICKLLLKHGADVNQSTDSSDTALSLAIWQNHTDVCLLLMHAGAHVDNVDKFGDTMLMDAAKHGNVSVMQLLLQKQGSHLDHVNKKGDSALIRAAWKGELAALTLLLDHGANPAIANKTGCTALIMACMNNNRACVKLLIERDTSPINNVDESGRSALAYLALFSPTGSGTIEEPYWHGMELLLERHARIDTPPNMGNLLLCRAANINQIRLASLLLEQGADINFSDPANKNRPALLAHLQGAPDFECTRFLVANHAKVDFQDTDGHTGLMFAIKHNSPEIAGLLLDAGASTILENKLGETAASMCMAMLQNFHHHIQQLQQHTQTQLDAEGNPIPSPALGLHQLSLERAQKCLQLLMDRSAREMGSGALLLQAAQHGEFEKLEEYLTLGIKENDGNMCAIEINFSDKSGRSALMLAAKGNHLSCVKLLLHHGALLNLRDKDGLTALTQAIRAGAKDTAELLAETIQGHSLSRNFHFASFGGGQAAGHWSSSGAFAGNGEGGNGSNHSAPGTANSGGNSGAGGMQSDSLSSAAFPTPSAQVFGLVASPQQMAQEEFDKSTNFLVKVAEQLRRYLLHGKQAAYDSLSTKSGPGGTGAGDVSTIAKPLPSSASSPLGLGTPHSSLPRSSSYFNSFPSPAQPPQSLSDRSRGMEPLPSIAASPRHGERNLAVADAPTNTTPTAASTAAFRALQAAGASTPSREDTVSATLLAAATSEVAVGQATTVHTPTRLQRPRAATDSAAGASIAFPQSE